MARSDRDFITRVDDAILVQCFHLTRLRGQPIRASIADFRQTSIENRDLCDTPESRDDRDIWQLRIGRCDLMLADPSDEALRRRAGEAMEHDR